MEFHMKLPRSKGEFAIFIVIISVLSVNIIAPLITCFEMGFSLSAWRIALSVIPYIWVSVVLFVLVTFKPAEWMTRQIVDPNDSFRTQTLVNIMCTVLLMSILLTVVGTWIGTQRVTLDPIRTFFHKWPRNFSISFAVEALFAQPIARWVLWKRHQRIDKKQYMLENESAGSIRMD